LCRSSPTTARENCADGEIVSDHFRPDDFAVALDQFALGLIVGNGGQPYCFSNKASRTDQKVDQFDADERNDQSTDAI
jgi:hypothetical protein